VIRVLDICGQTDGRDETNRLLFGTCTNGPPITFSALLCIDVIKTAINYRFVVLTIANYAIFTNYKAKQGKKTIHRKHKTSLMFIGRASLQ